MARDFKHYITGTADHVYSLAIDHIQPEVRRPWETYNKFCLMRNFPRLKEVLLVFSSGSEKDAEGQDGQIEFVDPRADQEDIMKLMEHVTESFSYEVGYDLRPVSPGPKEEEADEEECDGYGEPRLALIPKTKATWHHQPMAVACI